MKKPFPEFDPLAAKANISSEVAINALKREITNILDSYVGWYDPFCELIQNALDSVEKKVENNSSLKPLLRIIINLKDNFIIVSDNGLGLSKPEYQQFLAPHFSFKSGKARGHKGVGATYLAYGFNYMQITTKTGDFQATGKIVNARKWLFDENPAGNPKVCPDPSGPRDKDFNTFKTGVSICLQFDNTTYPGSLAWLNADTAEKWHVILSVKSGLGAFFENNKVSVSLKVIDSKGVETSKESKGISYCWPHRIVIVRKAQQMRVLDAKEKELFKKKGKNFKMPSAMTNLDAIYDKLTSKEIKNLLSLDSAEVDICNRFNPTIYFCYMYSAKVWSTFNEMLAVRQSVTIISPGIQIAADNMPQGELVQIPLKRNIGRQNQMHVLVHFDNCRADLGRKGFQKDIVEFCTSVSRKLIEYPLQALRYTLRPVTGVKDDIMREDAIDSWKEEMDQHEKDNPLTLVNENFFIPMKSISITSKPIREQDVIALFNQLIAGGVIRGIRIVSTNERFKYDGMYRVIFNEPTKNHLFNEKTNPLGVLPEYVNKHTKFVSKPKILEYKYSLDGLIEDLESGEKNSNDIGLVIVWATGEDYQGNFHITSLLDQDNLGERQYHGVTHVMTNVNTGQREMDLIVLEELIMHLNNPVESLKYQRMKYEE